MTHQLSMGDDPLPPVEQAWQYLYETLEFPTSTLLSMAHEHLQYASSCRETGDVQRAFNEPVLTAGILAAELQARYHG